MRWIHVWFKRCVINEDTSRNHADSGKKGLTRLSFLKCSERGAKEEKKGTLTATVPTITDKWKPSEDRDGIFTACLGKARRLKNLFLQHLPARREGSFVQIVYTRCTWRGRVEMWHFELCSFWMSPKAVGAFDARLR